MGGNISQLPPTPPNFPYFCVTFRQWDKIKLLHATDLHVSILRSAVEKCWPQGIQRESNDMGAYEFKFGGNPFSKNTSKSEALSIKHFCCLFLAEMKRAGWLLSVSTDLSRTTDLTTWFFERGQAALAPNVLCLSLSSHDKLQMVNAPSFIQQNLKQAVQTTYGYGIQDESSLGTDYELKLNGYPWYTASFEEGVYARRALLEIFRQFQAQKYTLMTTANLKGTADCLFFENDESAVPGEERFMMLSLNASDRIRLIDAPVDVIQSVEQCIRQYWALGLQDQKDYMSSLGCYEFKLSGYPWNSSGMEAVSSRLLITTILQALVTHGWAVCHSLDISRRVNDKAVLVLRSCPPVSIPHFCVSPNDLDKLRIINAPQDMVDLTAAIIQQSWPYGIQRHGPNSGCYEWKLGGQPWSAYAGNDYAHARHLMCLLLKEYAVKGWRVICSADVSAKYVHQQNGPDYPIDVHSWFFAYTAQQQSPSSMDGGKMAADGVGEMSASAPPIGFVNSGQYQPPNPAFPNSVDEPPPSYKDVIR